MEQPIQQLKQQVNTAGYLMKHYPQLNLKRNGNSFKGNCPFHKDSAPSFVVFPDGRYKCFSCPKQTSGDLINFVSEIEDITAKEACEMIAENENISVNFALPNPAHQQYYATMMDHVRRYWRLLQVNPDALFYLHSRGISDASITKFRLGLTDANEGQFRRDIMNIQNRISFPIFSHKSDVLKADCVAMGYRTLDPNDRVKYKNDQNHDDPADPLYGAFSKSKYLYGYSHAVSSIKDKGYAIVVEGYLDVISLNQSGIENSVATMGVSMSEAQMDALKSITSKLLFIYDPDVAGISSMESKLPDLIAKGFSVSFCLLHEMDPADLCADLEFDYAHVASHIKVHSKNAMEYMIEKYTTEYSQAVLQLRLKSLQRIMPLFDKMSAPEKTLWSDYLGKKLDMKI